MLRRSLALLVFGVSVVPITAVAVAEEDTDTSTSDKATADSPEAGQEASPATPPLPPSPAQVSDRKSEAKAEAEVEAKVEAKVEAQPESALESWKTEVHGYFRAPMTLGISSRPNPDQLNQLDPNDSTKKLPDGPSHLQLSYGPNRVMDWSYYSFAYTGLQEQDWAELFIHEKKKHVEAVIGWLGYWYGAAGYRNPDASWWPGMAYVTLDSDFEVAGIKPGVALTMGSFWPQFGYVEKYDTFTLGRFRMLGEQATLTLPLTEDLKVKVFQGFGTNRDGTYNFSLQNIDPLYAGKTGADLIAYGHVQVSYRNIVDLGLHYNYEFTRDPNLTADATPGSGKAYTDAANAHLSVAGAELNLHIPSAGRLWLSPSYISVRNGWALAGAGGIEVMHSQSGSGIAQNYMAWTGSPKDSTGTGSMMNLGFLYELALSDILPNHPQPQMKLSLFGLATKVKLDLPTQQAGATTLITFNQLTQVKFGADFTIIPKNWFSFTARWDQVNYDQDHPGYVFSAYTGRLSLFSHYLSGECIYLQYSHYVYGTKMVLAGTWPWNTPLVAGSTVVQAYGYSGQKPDEDVIKLQAQVRF
jgi:hypothetical protein